MQQKIRDWFKKNQRDLAFRHMRDPYFVWIAEVMLQQTRVEAVLPYFSNWIQQFPDIETLAKSSIESVIKCWEGLGYYSRARNIHSSAQHILQDFNGEIPSSLEELLQIRGIGPYTARAILSFAFKKKVAPVDGNVIRLITRFQAIDFFIEKAATQKMIQQYADDLLPDDQPYEIAESLIELGALVCRKKKPRCSVCPLSSQCKAYEKKQVDRFPRKKAQTKLELVEKSAAIFMHKQKVLIFKNQRGLMQDLHEFPTIEGHCSAEELLQAFDMQGRFIEKIGRITSFYTKYKQHLYGFIFQVKEHLRVPCSHFFVTKKEVKKLPFSSGHRKILEHL